MYSSYHYAIEWSQIAIPSLYFIVHEPQVGISNHEPVQAQALALLNSRICRSPEEDFAIQFYFRSTHYPHILFYSGRLQASSHKHVCTCTACRGSIIFLQPEAWCFYTNFGVFFFVWGLYLCDDTLNLSSWNHINLIVQEITGICAFPTTMNINIVIER